MKLQQNHRRWWIAGLFSYFVPGLGQLYNGQLIKALLMHIGMTVWGGLLFSLLFPMLQSSVTPQWVTTIFVLLIGSVILHWTIILESIRTAWKKRRETFDPKAYNRWIVYGAVIVLFGLVNLIETRAIRNHVIKPFRIPTQSMAPTLIPGDMLLSNQLYFARHNPERGDVVIFHPPGQPKGFYIKRIVGLPGDTLSIQDNVVFINGEQLPESYLNPETGKPSRGDYAPIVLPPNGYYLLGDNRNNSQDSRDWGTIGRGQIVGKPMFVYFSSGCPSLFDRIFSIRFDRIGKIIR